MTELGPAVQGTDLALYYPHSYCISAAQHQKGADMISIATVSTEHFAFMAIGRNPEHARDLIMRAWHRHVDTYDARVDLVVRDDINVTSGEIGEAFRDGGRVIDATTPEPYRLAWQDAHNDVPGDQTADSRLCEAGCTSMYWSLGTVAGGRWAVELIGVSHAEVVNLAGIHLGTFTGEADAKAAAEHYENKGV